MEELNKLESKMSVTMDQKIDYAFEKLRNDNLYIWKQSIALAQEEFNEKGVAKSLNLLPKVLLDKTDLKRTVNSLIVEEESIPKPALKANAPPSKPSAEPASQPTGAQAAPTQADPN